MAIGRFDENRNKYARLIFVPLLLYSYFNMGGGGGGGLVWRFYKLRVQRLLGFLSHRDLVLAFTLALSFREARESYLRSAVSVLSMVGCSGNLRSGDC